MAGYLGNIPTAVPLTSADLADGIITSAKIVDGTIVNADINASAAIAGTKLSGAGKVLKYAQVSSGSFDAASGNWNITSTTLTNTGRTVTFTPTSASSIITGSGLVFKLFIFKPRLMTYFKFLSWSIKIII
jgi:hypothetical protein